MPVGAALKLAQLAESLHAVHLWHHMIQEDDVEIHLLAGGDGLAAAVHRGDFHVVGGEDLLGHHKIHGLVVDYQSAKARTGELSRVKEGIVGVKTAVEEVHNRQEVEGLDYGNDSATRGNHCRIIYHSADLHHGGELLVVVGALEVLLLGYKQM